jgi:uncharacterized delta-60 repeat protein
MATQNTAPTFIVRDGKITTDFNGVREAATDMVIQPDGKILAVGYSRVADGGFKIALIRYNADGTVDKLFNTNEGSIANLSVSGDKIFLQSDNKILISIHEYPDFLKIFNDNNILIRYNSDGSIDNSFQLDFKTPKMYLEHFTLQNNKKILATGRDINGDGHDISLIKYNLDGTLDTNFGVNGIVNTSLSNTYFGIRSITTQIDGKILIAGDNTDLTGNTNFSLARFNTDGSLDSNFGDHGKITTSLSRYWSSVSSVITQSDGKIIVGGTSSSLPAGYGDGQVFAVVRYNLDGTLDSTFNGNGKVLTPVNIYANGIADIALQNDGKILAAGYAYNSGTANAFAVVRYNVDGSLDTSFDSDGKVITPFGDKGSFSSSIKVQSDGKILVAGQDLGEENSSQTLRFDLLRYNSDGSLDTTFSEPQNSLTLSPNYTENATFVILDANVQIFDSELSSVNNFNGASLTLSRHNNSNPQDVFSSKNEGTLTALNTNSYFAVDGVTIGRVSINSQGALKLVFNSNATQSLVNRAMQQIAYANTSDAPPATVQIDWLFDDGNSGLQGTGGALSVIGSTTINIDATNDAPIVSSFLPDQSVTAN